MSKQSLRSIGLGFLAASILTGAFAVFYQGNVPVDGVTLPSLLKGEHTQKLKEEESMAKADLESVSLERDELSSQISKLKDEQESLKSKVDKQNESIAYYESLKEKWDESQLDEETTDEERTEEDPAADPQGDGTFVVNQGEGSAEIASRLESEGYVESAAEFQELIDQWNLATVIQAGEYELTPDMSIHEIASQLTHGAYYYQ